MTDAVARAQGTEALVTHIRWQANRLQPNPDPHAYHPAAYNLRKAADAIESLQSKLVASEQERQKWYDLNDYAEKRVLELSGDLSICLWLVGGMIVISNAVNELDRAVGLATTGDSYASTKDDWFRKRSYRVQSLTNFWCEQLGL